MSTIGVVVLIVIGLIFLGGAIRAMPLGRQRDAYIGPSTSTQMIAALPGSAAFLVVGFLLFSN
ncbi:MAG: hypothetical protein WEC33_07010 [Dehalococcoidia bacterium]